MIKIQSITNKALGFTPYKAGNQIGWIKTATDSSGITRTIKKITIWYYCKGFKNSRKCSN